MGNTVTTVVPIFIKKDEAGASVWGVDGDFILTSAELPFPKDMVTKSLPGNITLVLIEAFTEAHVKNIINTFFFKVSYMGSLQNLSLELEGKGDKNKAILRFARHAVATEWLKKKRSPGVSCNAQAEKPPDDGRGGF